MKQLWNGFYEQEADGVAKAVTSGEVPQVQRQPEEENVLLDQLVALMNRYNSFPVRDINYDHHLAQLRAIEQKAWKIERVVEDFRFLNKRGTWRSLGGPSHYRYYRLLGKLRKFSGYADRPAKYKEGIVTKEIERVEKQKERGLEVSA